MIRVEDPKLQVKELIRRDPDMFEKCVLCVITWDMRKALLYAPIIGKLFDGSEVTDFTNQYHLSIYQTLMQYYRYQCAGGIVPEKQPPFSMDIFQQSMADLAKTGQYVPLSLASDITNYFISEIGKLYGSLHICNTLVDAGMTHWLRERRKEVLIQRASTEMWEAALLADNIRKENNHIDGLSRADSRMFGFGHGIDTPRPDVPRTRISLSGVTEKLGGGFGRGESYITIAANGAGKTVLTMQLAAEFALGGLKGMVISTEQLHWQLEPRIVSNVCHIPFNLIKDGITPTSVAGFSAEQRARYRELRDKLTEKNLLIYDWPKGSSRSVTAGMEEDIMQAGEKLGQIDFFILDWLGSALGEKSSDTSEVRMMIQNGADKTAEFAAKLGCIGIVNAQAAPATSINKPRIDQTNIADCKSASNNMTGILGVTLMYDKDCQEDATKPADDQFICIPKSRMGTTGNARVRRDFAYQRFTNPRQ